MNVDSLTETLILGSDFPCSYNLKSLVKKLEVKPNLLLPSDKISNCMAKQRWIELGYFLFEEAIV